MSRSLQLADVLAEYIRRRGLSPGILSRISGVPKATIVNWQEGRVTKPRTWQPLVKLAGALDLNEIETTRLLQAGGHPALAALAVRDLSTDDRALLSRWPNLTHSALPPWQITRPLIVDAETLQAARNLLQQLPIDHLPEPAPLPSGSHMLLRRNPLFVNREATLLALAHRLVGQGTIGSQRVDTVAVTGLGGIGKTQLATEFVHRYGQFFAGGVFWLSFANNTTVATEIATAGRASFLTTYPDFGSLSLDEQVRLICQSWHTALPRLLVFDNCDDEDLLQRWRPTSGGSVVLVTTRRAAWHTALGVQTLSLGTLPRAESIRMLRTYRAIDPSETATLDEIAAELGDLPLALHLAGNYLQRYRYAITPAEYLRQLRQITDSGDGAGLQHPSLHDPEGLFSPTGHTQSVARTFALSYDQLNEDNDIDTLALRLLAHAAILAPGEPIPRRLLHATVLHGDTSLHRTFEIEDAILRLLALGLMEMATQGDLRMHRLVAQYVTARTKVEDARTAVQNAFLEIVAPLNEADDFQAMLGLQHHLRIVTQGAIAHQDTLAADLCTALGYHLWRIGDFTSAQPYIEAGTGLWERHPTDRPEQLASSRNLLGLLYQMQGRWEEAQHLFEQALAIWEWTLGQEHRDTAAALNNLGYLHLLRGDYQRAASNIQRALTIMRKEFGLQHPRTARCINNLGQLSLKQGWYNRAQRYLQLTLTIREQELPANHLSTAQTLNDLGEVAQAKDDLTTAWDYHQRALAMRQALFGDHHHDTAESFAQLGRVLYARGALAEARAYLERALAISNTILGAHHRETAVILVTFGTLLGDQEGPAYGLPYLQQALTTLQQQVGHDHPDTATALHNIGVLYLRQHAYSAARERIARALDIRERRLSAHHPAIAQGRTVLQELDTLLGRQNAVECGA